MLLLKNPQFLPNFGSTFCIKNLSISTQKLNHFYVLVLFFSQTVCLAKKKTVNFCEILSRFCPRMKISIWGKRKATAIVGVIHKPCGNVMGELRGFAKRPHFNKGRRVKCLKMVNFVYGWPPRVRDWLPFMHTIFKRKILSFYFSLKVCLTKKAASSIYV